MADMTATRSKTRPPTPPGKLLADTVLPAIGKTKTEIAKLLGVSRQTLYDILACKQPVTPQMAVRIGKLCGNGPRIWLTMQAAHDLWKAERSVDVSKNTNIGSGLGPRRNGLKHMCQRSPFLVILGLVPGTHSSAHSMLELGARWVVGMNPTTTT